MAMKLMNLLFAVIAVAAIDVLVLFSVAKIVVDTHGEQRVSKGGRSDSSDGDGFLIGSFGQGVADRELVLSLARESVGSGLPESQSLLAGTKLYLALRDDGFGIDNPEVFSVIRGHFLSGRQILAERAMMYMGTQMQHLDVVYKFWSLHFDEIKFEKIKKICVYTIAVRASPNRDAYLAQFGIETGSLATAVRGYKAGDRL